MRVLVATDAWHPQVNGVVRTYERLALEAWDAADGGDSDSGETPARRKRRRGGRRRRKPGGEKLKFVPRAPGQGFNSILKTTHRQNFLVPPRRYRSFPLVEMLS
jgi:hypothetical protein